MSTYNGNDYIKSKVLQLQELVKFLNERNENGMTLIAREIVDCKVTAVQQLLKQRKFDFKTLNFIYNNDDSVLSLAIKHCPDLFEEIATFETKINGNFVKAIEESTFNRLSTDDGIAHQTLLMMAIKRGLEKIVEFVTKISPNMVILINLI